MSNYVVYKLTCIVNNKAYVGMTNNFARRMREHRFSKSKCSALAHAIRKHGWNAFVCSVIHSNLSVSEAQSQERQAISACNSLTPSGYNLTTGGECPIFTLESRQKISAAHKGKPKSTEFLARMSALKRGRRYVDFMDNKTAMQVRAKQSAALKIRHQLQPSRGAQHPNAKHYTLTSPSGETYDVHGTLGEFCAIHKLTLTLVRQLVNGKKQSYKGWTGHMKENK